VRKFYFTTPSLRRLQTVIQMNFVTGGGHNSVVQGGGPLVHQSFKEGNGWTVTGGPAGGSSDDQFIQSVAECAKLILK
jgi:hypothetical protein